ncbi:MAG: hypothetical protein K0R57_2059 [Paenibacillaceae bacterium]|jgi:uncharacterized damage-inducible protein DinB|nr:hypothetical protein [Paenibacillaceae bacterium]
MNNDSFKQALANQFTEIERRLLLTIQQLDDEQLNWRPDETSNSIANLAIHLHGNINERIGKGIGGRPYNRQREQEFALIKLTKPDITALVAQSFGLLKEITAGITDEQLQQTQALKNGARRNEDILLSSVAHFSEHLGQIIYIAKTLLRGNYASAG